MNTENFLALLDEERYLDNEEARKNKDLIEQLMEWLTCTMKREDSLFRNMFRKKLFVGSFYDGTRVGHADEFDCNFVLELPFQPEDVEIERSRQIPGHVFFHKNHLPHTAELRRFFSNRGYFLHDRFHDWAKEVLNKCFQSLEKEDWPPALQMLRKISYSETGPAFTLRINTEEDKMIDVDVVFVISTEKYSLEYEGNVSEKFSRLPQKFKELFLVPKPHDNIGQIPGNYVWRLSFPLAERELLSQTGGCIKPLIRLFKYISKAYDWKELSSYQIKHLFLTQIDKFDCWPTELIADLFIYMLKILKRAVSDQCLPFYFDREDNLLKISKQRSMLIVTEIDRMITSFQTGKNSDRVKDSPQQNNSFFPRWSLQGTVLLIGCVVILMFTL